VYRVLNVCDVGYNYPNSVYVGRPSDFGNPFSLKDNSRSEAISRFENLVHNNKDFYDLIMLELRHKNLLCWCSPEPCHADVLLRVANE
jgi:hypothetical protein